MRGAGFRGLDAQALGRSRARRDAAAPRPSVCSASTRCSSRAARSIARLRPGGRRAPALSSRTRRISVATSSCAAATPELVFGRALRSAPSTPTIAFSWRWCSAEQAGDRRGGLRDRLFEAGGLVDQLFELRRVRLGDPLAQLLDLALGRENAARLGLGAAGDEMAAAEHIAVERRDRDSGTVGAMRAAVSKLSAINASPITAWIACGKGPPMRATLTSCTVPCGGTNVDSAVTVVPTKSSAVPNTSLRGPSSGRPTTKPQRPASCSRTSYKPAAA